MHQSRDKPSAEQPEKSSSPSTGPSGWPHRIAIAVTAGAAGLVSIYMGLYQVGWIEKVWDPVFDGQTRQVLESSVSHVIESRVGIPDALLGALVYFTEFILVLAGSRQRWYRRPWVVLLLALVVAGGAAAGVGLVAMQAFVVQAWCFLCLLTAAASLVLVVLSFKEVKASLGYLHAVWKHSGSRSELWAALWGGRAAISA